MCQARQPKAIWTKRSLPRAGIGVRWMDYSAYPEYHQLYPPFEHAVSVIDLLFNEGPNAWRYMKSFQDTPPTQLSQREHS